MSWEENVRSAAPYVPGEQPQGGGIIKLNTNESPYPPCPGVQKALKDFDCGRLRLYPDPEAAELTQCIAQYYGVNREQVFVGVGSDDVLSMAFLTYFNGGLPILFPDITYSFYDVWAELYRIPYEAVPLDGDFRIIPEDYMKACGGVVLPNPNAPTGIFEEPGVIERIVRSHPDCVVIVDEAYVDFGGTSCLPLIRQYDNLLVVRTFSKSRALAGLRIGYAFGSSRLIRCLNDVKYSFNSYTLSSLSLRLGAESIRDDGYFKETVGKIAAAREWVKGELVKMGFSFPDSKGNFIFATHRCVPAGLIYEHLKENRIYVRYFNKPRIDNYLRITIGTEQEMKQLLTVLNRFIENQEKRRRSD